MLLGGSWHISSSNLKWHGNSSSKKLYQLLQKHALQQLAATQKELARVQEQYQSSLQQLVDQQQTYPAEGIDDERAAHGVSSHSAVTSSVMFAAPAVAFVPAAVSLTAD